MCLCTPHPEPGPRCPSDWPSSAQQTVVLAGRGKRCQGRKREREREEEEKEKDRMGEDGESRGKNAPFTVGAPACPRPPEGSPLFLPLSLSLCGVWTAVSGDQVTGGAGTSSVLAGVCVCECVANVWMPLPPLHCWKLSYATLDSMHIVSYNVVCKMAIKWIRTRSIHE